MIGLYCTDSCTVLYPLCCRPSIVIGDEDAFYNNILYQLKFGASMWLIDGGDQPLQPTYVTDVSAAVGQALQKEDSVGKTYYLGGPEILT